MSDRVLIFADGACKGNPGMGGWAYIIATKDRVIEDCGGATDTTNNKMEISGFLNALEVLFEEKISGEVHVHLDSQYVLGGASAWIYGWQKRGWVTMDSEPVKNRDLWQKVAEILKNLKGQCEIKYFYVPGHAGVPGNERVDELASHEAEGDGLDPYHGPRSKYSVDLEKGLSTEEFEIQRTSQPKEKIPVYYLSYLNGQIYRDPTWAECEARVRGRAGAKYKKVKSLDEEKEVLKSWGHSAK